jgi:integrase
MALAGKSGASLDTAREKTAPTRDERKITVKIEDRIRSPRVAAFSWRRIEGQTGNWRAKPPRIAPPPRGLGNTRAHKSVLQRAVNDAVRRVRIGKHVGCHTFGPSFATDLLRDGHDVRTVRLCMPRLYYYRRKSCRGAETLRHSGF